MELNLRGRRALVTGASKGIGLAIAQTLAAEGCHVHLAARTQAEIDEERWRKAWYLKLYGAINPTREIYGGMCARGRGVIINIAGLAGERPDAYYIAGSCANAALIMFSRSLGGDSIRHGVRVIAVNPGPVETEKHIADTRRLAQEKFGDEERWRDVMAGLPMRRAATTDEVSSMVAFLASDRAAYISGSAILIDGGL